MDIIYHGSTLEIPHPLVNMGRRYLDFGPGFYLTSIYSQAERWALRMQLVHASENAVVNEYTFDREAAQINGTYWLNFPAYDEDWLKFVVASRKGDEPWRDYDVIEGGIANDRVIDTVEDYLNGIITISQALGQLAFTEPNHQICILNQQVADNYLIFRTSHKVHV